MFLIRKSTVRRLFYATPVDCIPAFRMVHEVPDPPATFSRKSAAVISCLQVDRTISICFSHASLLQKTV